MFINDTEDTGMFKDILLHLLNGYFIEVSFRDFDKDIRGIIESKCYKALEKIRAVIKDDSLDDTGRYAEIKEIIQKL